MKTQRKPLDRLGGWEWSTLVGAWRYYENRGTIVASTFPEDMINRFFTGAYSNRVQHMIAHQFSYVDHGLRGEEDWPIEEHAYFGSNLPWLKFFRFCEGYCKGFHKVFLQNGRTKQEVEAFHVDRNDRWYPVEKYLEAPHFEQYCEPKYIKKIDGKPVAKASAMQVKKNNGRSELILNEGGF